MNDPDKIIWSDCAVFHPRVITADQQRTSRAFFALFDLVALSGTSARLLVQPTHIDTEPLVKHVPV